MMDITPKLKQILIAELALEDLTPEDIQNDTALFGDGLGLDSLDAVELVVVVKKHFGVEIQDMEEGRKVLQSIKTLAAFIKERQHE